jgi:alkaline phosphatase D
VRSHDGPEAADLAGYRARYAQYLSDPDLRAARAACPWFVVWDDHEVENDYAAHVPQDPVDQPTFAARRLAAYRAWWEHMPVRIERPHEGADTVIHRRATFGDLLDLVLLDGRQFRSDQACGGAELSAEPPCPEALDPARTMLGAGQEAWAAEVLGASRAAWAAIGQQTVVTDLRLPNGGVLNYDQWDGYAPARDRLLAAAAPVAGRTVVLTGDIHLAGVGVLPGIGTEFVTTSVSSSGDIPPALQPILASFDDIVDAELIHRGYVRHTVTPSTWSADYRIVGDVTDPASATTTWRTFTVAAGASDVVTAA